MPRTMPFAGFGLRRNYTYVYNFSSHLTVSLEGINMTDEFETTFQDTAVQRFQFDRHAGRQYYLGMRFKL